ncbi:hypothetical protein OIV83_005584 [Microbotryomycetes sp. JL201]|nr:hypothetical protein OIV83_005584 [Microbotryomycetes sp. JL201]
MAVKVDIGSSATPMLGARATLSRRSSWSATPAEQPLMSPAPRTTGLYSSSRPSKPRTRTKTMLRLALFALLCYILFIRTPTETKDKFRSKLDEYRYKRPGSRQKKAELIHVPGIGRHTATVILMHGLGSSAEITLAPVRRIHRRLFQVSWQIPNSGKMAVNALKGAIKTAWFDMSSLDNSEDAPLPTNEDESNMKIAVDKVHKLVDAELAKGIEPTRIVLAGFSQVTLLAGLSANKELGGMMCLSGWLPLTDQLHKDVNGTIHPMQSPHAHKMPIFWGHGTDDAVIRYGWGEKSRDVLKSMGFTQIESHAYPGTGHWVAAEEEEDMRHWLARIVPPL